MPFIHLRLAAAPGVEVDDHELARLLTDLAASTLGKRRDLTAVRIERCSPQGWFIGGLGVAPRLLSTAHVQIQVTAGSNTPQEKARFVRDAFEQLSTLLGGLHDTSYVVVEEVAADGWGYGGQTQAARKAAVAA